MLTDERFEALAAKYIDTVYAVAFSALKNRADAEDVTQDVLIKLYRTERDFESEEHVKRWLIRVTVNQCRKVFRAPWRRTEPLEDYADRLGFEQPEDRGLFLAVMELERKYRLPVLRLLDGGDRLDAGHAAEHREHSPGPGQSAAAQEIDGGGMT